MSEKILILGYGPIGAAIAQQLTAAGRAVTVAQRRRPPNLPAGIDFVTCDVLDAQAVQCAAAGASAMVCALGLAYSASVWERDWPVAMTNMLAACEASGARFLFIDDIYMYGPQDVPLHEGLPLTDHGRKPKLRAQISRQWLAASETGQVKATALRVPDFYGPGASLSIFGDATIGAMAKGRPAMLVTAPDLPHSIAYVPDVARAAILLLDAPDEANGQAWHMPCVPAPTPRRVLELAAAALGLTPRIRAMPGWLIGAIGLFQPFLREWHEMRFQQQRPFFVDGTKFTRRFGFVPTLLEEGILATALAFKGR